MNKPPRLRTNDRGIGNWKEIQRWGRLNDPAWQFLEEQACVRGLTEAEHMQWLVAGLLEVKYQLLERVVTVERQFVLPTPEQSLLGSEQAQIETICDLVP
jgi:hypothetical protein